MPTDPMNPVFFKVRNTIRETQDTVTLELEPPPPTDFSFKHGQFNMLYAFGIGEIPVSISGADSKRVLHTIRNVGAVSGALCRTEKTNLIGIRGPFGSSWPIERAVGKHALVIAGGLGIAPLRSLVTSLIERRSEFEKITLLYGAKNPSEIIYRLEIEEWIKKGQIEAMVTVNQADSGWKRSVGHVGNLLSRISVSHQTVAYLCGPEIMLRFIAKDLRTRGLNADDIFLSMERNMKCAIGLCGHCQFGSPFVCKDGPVFNYSTLSPLLRVREL